MKAGAGRQAVQCLNAAALASGLAVGRPCVRSAGLTLRDALMTSGLRGSTLPATLFGAEVDPLLVAIVAVDGEESVYGHQTLSKHKCKSGPAPSRG